MVDSSAMSDRRALWLKFPGLVLLCISIGLYCYLAPKAGQQEEKDWHHLWLGGRMAVEGHFDRLYDPSLQYEVYSKAHPEGRGPQVWEGRYLELGCFNYPPPTALAYATLAWMPIHRAAVAHACLNLALALVTMWLFFRYILTAGSFIWLMIGLLAYFPFFSNFALGQNAMMTTTVVLIAWALCNQRRDLFAGLVLGLLICKPNWFLAVGWIPFIHGRWRVAGGMVAGAFAIICGSMLIMGAEPFHDYIERFPKVADLHNLPGYHLELKYSALGVFRKWFGVTSQADAWGWISAALVGLITWKVTWGAWKPGQTRFQELMACSILASLWINPHLNYYDLVPVVMCLIVLCSSWAQQTRFQKMIMVLLVALAYAAVPWDESWGYSFAFPVPSISLLLLWMWFVCRLGLRRTAV